MNFIKTKGALGIRGHIMLFVLIGPLVSEAIPLTPEKEVAFLKLRLDSLKTRYKELCNQYSGLAANCSAPGLTCTECPPKWFQIGDQCFLIHTDKKNWLDSVNDCKATGGHLAILTSREEHEALEKESKIIGAFHHFWIGLTDSEHEGKWKWVDNSTLTHPFWDRVTSLEPDNNTSGGPEGEDCAVLDSHSETWFDVPCNFLYPRICQMDTIPLH